MTGDEDLSTDTKQELLEANSELADALYHINVALAQARLVHDDSDLAEDEADDIGQQIRDLQQTVLTGTEVSER